MNEPTGRILTTPITPDVIKSLRAGDVVYISGTVCCGMEHLARRAATEPIPVPEEHRSIWSVSFGKLQVDEGTGRTKRHGEIVPPFNTTGLRSMLWIPKLIAEQGVRLVLSKDGFGHDQPVRDACQKYGAVAARPYTIPPQVNVTGSMLGVEAKFWMDDTTTGGGFVFRVERLGPYVINIDSHGGSLVADQEVEVRSRLSEIHERLGINDFDYAPLDYRRVNL